jgi:hypothetical protein
MPSHQDGITVLLPVLDAGGCASTRLSEPNMFNLSLGIAYMANLSKRKYISSVKVYAFL